MAYRAAQRSDLRNLAERQEAWRRDHGTFTTDIGRLDFQSSTGVSVTLTSGNSAGWTATATHSQPVAGTCVGGIGPEAPTRGQTYDNRVNILCDELDDPYGLRPVRNLAVGQWLLVVAMIAMVRVAARRRAVPRPKVDPLVLMAVLNPLWLLLLGSGGADCGFTLSVLTVAYIPIALLIGLWKRARIIAAAAA